MRIETANLSDLKPLERNVRQHPEAQIKELVKSLQQFGQTRALVVDEENIILIGNGLYEAMIRLGYDSCSVYRVSGMSEKEKKKLILSDNKTYDLGLTDFDEIQKYIDEITIDGDFEIAGFDEAILREMTRSLEAVEREVMSYGVTEATPAPAVPSSPVGHSETVPSTPTPVQANTGHTEAPREAVAAVEHYERAEVETTRKIVCPSCGEVIYLD